MKWRGQAVILLLALVLFSVLVRHANFSERP
jgi:hypothetical protein